MKFHQLPIGARFSLRGTDYRKISPLKAASEADDSQRLVPRSAEVARLDDAADHHLGGRPLPSRLTGSRVERGIRQLLDDSRAALAHVDPPLAEAQQVQVAAAIEAASQRLLASLAATSNEGAIDP